MENRMPAVAGTFYPAAPTVLKNQISTLFEKATRVPETDVAALIVPHAGYAFSGQVAASAYAKLNRQARYKNIFIIGPSHRKYFEGVSIYPKGQYVTPLGKASINEETASMLIEKHAFIYYDEAADQAEHSLEVQLPFLQYWLYTDFKIVPIIIGCDRSHLCHKLAEALKPWFNSENLFVISSDFSHYPPYDIACKTDEETADAILTNNNIRLKTCCDKNSNSLSKNLLTGLCGAAAVETLLHLTVNNKKIAFEKIVYKNSGDIPSGDKNRVVGYWAIAINRINKSLNITEADKSALLNIARDSLLKYFKKRKRKGDAADTEHSATLKRHCGVFVTLKKQGELRGCIGKFSPKDALYQTVSEMTIAAATRDLRFNPVTPDELDQLEIEISVLTPLEMITSIDQIQLGKHGIFIRKGVSSGTYLPQVALDTNWTKEEFLGHCARDKAGIGWNGWKNGELYTYEAIAFCEK